MTTCIASKADDGKTLILMADKLSSNIILGHKVEDTEKILPLSNKSYLMIAGNDKFNREVYRLAQGLLNTEKFSPLQWAEAIKDIFSQLRLDFLEDSFLKPRGLDRRTYLTLQKEVTLQLSDIMANFQHDILNSLFIVAGIDSNDGMAHIYQIGNPGVFLGEEIHYSAIGAGASHAMNSLYFRQYNRALPLEAALYLVYEAKKTSESAMGVGDTESALIVSGDLVHPLELDELAKLGEQYSTIQNMRAEEVSVKKATRKK